VSRNLYTDCDRFVCAWLRNLVAAEHLPAGDVHEADIRNLKPGEILGTTTAHFFAGIGGWPLALAMAGWPADRPVWTASCPCQPFSCAGARQGEADERHLWPALRAHLSVARPATLFGEQVASADGYRWLARVRADLEELGYAVGAADLPAASLGAPHKRNRLFFVAYADEPGRQGGEIAHKGRIFDALGSHCVGDTYCVAGGRAAREVPGAQAEARGPVRRQPDRPRHAGRCVGDADRPGREQQRLAQHGGEQGAPGPVADRSSAWRFWDGAELRRGADGIVRRLVASIPPLAPRLPGRVARLRASGNSIVPQVAATFVRAFLEVEA